MSSQDEIPRAGHDARRNLLLYRALTGSLASAIERGGGLLCGMSVKINGYDCLVTLRAEFPGGAQVAFIGGETPAGCFLKAMREAKSETLRWKADRYANRET